mgnify:CR=1 FL=1
MIIAEIGQNHNGNMQLAKKLIVEAAANGADIAKFQIYDAKKTFNKKNNPWYAYNCKTELNFNQIKYLNQICKKQKIEFMASVFDEERLKWLIDLKVKKIKIASRTINDQKLINLILKTNIPTLISLGFWKSKQLPKFKGNIMGYLYCVSKYPAPIKDINFNKIDFKNKYIGFSDHTVGLSASKISLTLGSKIVEKHFTLDKKQYGPDHICSMNPRELLELSNFKKDLKIILKNKHK